MLLNIEDIINKKLKYYKNVMIIFGIMQKLNNQETSILKVHASNQELKNDILNL